MQVLCKLIVAWACVIWCLSGPAVAGASDAPVQRVQSTQPIGTGDLYVNTSTGGLYLVQAETGAVAYLMKTPQFFDIALDTKDRLFGITAQGDLYRVLPHEKSVKRIGNAGAFVNALNLTVAAPCGVQGMTGCSLSMSQRAGQPRSRVFRGSILRAIWPRRRMVRFMPPPPQGRRQRMR